MSSELPHHATIDHSPFAAPSWLQPTLTPSGNRAIRIVVQTLSGQYVLATTAADLHLLKKPATHASPECYVLLNSGEPPTKPLVEARWHIDLVSVMHLTLPNLA